jgi:ferric-dicitrate binding protein FerR (iron transport regulator)
MAKGAENITVNDDLLSKYFSGGATPEEAMTIDAWKFSSEANQQEFDALWSAWNATSLHPHRVPNIRDAWREMQPLPKRLQAKRAIIIRWAIAASVLIGLAIPAALLFNGNKKSTPQHVITATLNKPEQLLLPDSSSVTISPGSSITYAFTENERNVVLMGNGYFDIKPVANRPFIITTGAVKIQVLGTSFHVSDTDTAIIVKVINGRILMYSGQQQAIISAGQTGTYLKKEKQLALDQFIFRFDNEDLEIVSATLSKAYHKKIIVRDPEIASLKISSNFQNKPLDYILEVIATTLNIKYTTNPNNDEIYFEKAN